MTGSQIGFVSLMGDDGLLHDIAIKDIGWEQCLIYGKTVHHRSPENFVMHGLYGSIVNSSGKGFFINDLPSHPDSIGLPHFYPQLQSFLGVPLSLDGKIKGLLAVANRDGGYSDEQQEDLEAIVPVIMEALQRKRSEEDLREAYENLQVQSEELHVQSEELRMQNEELQIKSEELHAAYETTLESEKRFRTMANAIPQLVWIAHPDGYIYWYNERWYAYTGNTLEQMEGWGWHSVHDPEVLQKVLERWKASISTGQMFDMEFPLRGADGIFRPFLTRVLPLKDATGNILQWFGTSTDVTERKKTEEALRLSNIYNRSLIEASLDPLVTIGHDGKITDANISAEVITGYLRRELIGTDFTRYFTEPGKAKEVYQEVFKEGFVSDYALEIQHRDGSTTPVLYNASIYRDESGEVLGVFAAARDITERKKAEEKNSNLSEYCGIIK